MMEKFIVFGKYCDDAINKREPFRKNHLDRLRDLKDRNILITLGPTKCIKYFFAIFVTKNENELRELIEKDIYWQEGIWIKFDIYPWIQAF